MFSSTSATPSSSSVPTSPEPPTTPTSSRNMSYKQLMSELESTRGRLKSMILMSEKMKKTYESNLTDLRQEMSDQRTKELQKMQSAHHAQFQHLQLETENWKQHEKEKNRMAMEEMVSKRVKEEVSKALQSYENKFVEMKADLLLHHRAYDELKAKNDKLQNVEHQWLSREQQWCDERKHMLSEIAKGRKHHRDKLHYATLLKYMTIHKYVKDIKLKQRLAPLHTAILNMIVEVMKDKEISAKIHESPELSKYIDDCFFFEKQEEAYKQQYHNKHANVSSLRLSHTYIKDFLHMSNSDTLLTSLIEVEHILNKIIHLVLGYNNHFKSASAGFFQRNAALTAYCIGMEKELTNYKNRCDRQSNQIATTLELLARLEVKYSQVCRKLSKEERIAAQKYLNRHGVSWQPVGQSMTGFMPVSPAEMRRQARLALQNDKVIWNEVSNQQEQHDKLLDNNQKSEKHHDKPEEKLLEAEEKQLQLTDGSTSHPLEEDDYAADQFDEDTVQHHHGHDDNFNHDKFQDYSGKTNDSQNNDADELSSKQIHQQNMSESQKALENPEYIPSFKSLPTSPDYSLLSPRSLRRKLIPRSTTIGHGLLLQPYSSTPRGSVEGRRGETLPMSPQHLISTTPIPTITSMVQQCVNDLEIEQNEHDLKTGNKQQIKKHPPPHARPHSTILPSPPSSPSPPHSRSPSVSPSRSRSPFSHRTHTSIQAHMKRKVRQRPHTSMPVYSRAQRMMEIEEKQREQHHHHQQHQSLRQSRSPSRSSNHSTSRPRTSTHHAHAHAHHQQLIIHPSRAHAHAHVHDSSRDSPRQYHTFINNMNPATRGVVFQPQQQSHQPSSHTEPSPTPIFYSLPSAQSYHSQQTSSQPTQKYILNGPDHTRWATSSTEHEQQLFAQVQMHENKLAQQERERSRSRSRSTSRAQARSQTTARPSTSSSATADASTTRSRRRRSSSPNRQPMSYHTGMLSHLSKPPTQRKAPRAVKRKTQGIDIYTSSSDDDYITVQHRSYTPPPSQSQIRAMDFEPGDTSIVVAGEVVKLNDDEHSNSDKRSVPASTGGATTTNSPGSNVNNNSNNNAVSLVPTPPSGPSPSLTSSPSPHISRATTASWSARMSVSARSRAITQQNKEREKHELEAYRANPTPRINEIKHDSPYSSSTILSHHNPSSRANPQTDNSKSTPPKSSRPSININANNNSNKTSSHHVKSQSSPRTKNMIDFLTKSIIDGQITGPVAAKQQQRARERMSQEREDLLRDFQKQQLELQQQHQSEYEAQERAHALELLQQQQQEQAEIVAAQQAAAKRTYHEHVRPPLPASARGVNKQKSQQQTNNNPQQQQPVKSPRSSSSSHDVPLSKKHKKGASSRSSRTSDTRPTHTRNTHANNKRRSNSNKNAHEQNHDDYDDDQFEFEATAGEVIREISDNEDENDNDYIDEQYEPAADHIQKPSVSHQHEQDTYEEDFD